MEFLQKNARAIIIALLAAGVVVAISASGDNNNEETATQDSSEVASTDAVEGPVAPEVEEEVAEEASESQAETETETEATSADEETVSDEDGASTEQEDSSELETADVSGDVVRNEDDYSVAAAAGDGQTTLMRKLITQYESENDVQLTAPQRLYAETNLVDDIGQSESIEVGEEVKLSGADIKVRVEEARNLSEDKLALWSQYL